jgi:hypothetical protein
MQSSFQSTITLSHIHTHTHVHTAGDDSDFVITGGARGEVVFRHVHDLSHVQSFRCVGDVAADSMQQNDGDAHDAKPRVRRDGGGGGGGVDARGSGSGRGDGGDGDDDDYETDDDTASNDDDDGINFSASDAADWALMEFSSSDDDDDDDNDEDDDDDDDDGGDEVRKQRLAKKKAMTSKSVEVGVTNGGSVVAISVSPDRSYMVRMHHF